MFKKERNIDYLIKKMDEMPSQDYDPDEEFIDDTGGYSKKSGFDKGAVVQNKIEKCLDSLGKDMKPGHLSWILDKQGNAKPQEIPDFRKEFIGNVRGLMAILAPEIRKDEKMKGIVINFNKKVSEIFNKYAYRERLGKRHYDDKSGITSGYNEWVYSDKIYMPELGAILLDNHPAAPRSTNVQEKAGLWDKYHNLYYQELVDAYTALLDELSDLISRVDYFKTTSSW